MATKKTKEIRKRRKNFLPTFIVIIFLWAGILFEIFFVEPTAILALPIFFILIFLTLLFTFSSLFLNTRRGVVISTALTLFLLLMYFGVGNLINLFLLAGVAITIEVYFSRN